MDARLARQVVGFVQRLRQTELTKLPGVAETLDWAAALMALGAPHLSPEVIDPTLGVLLKYQEDVRAIRGDRAAAYLAEVQAGGTGLSRRRPAGGPAGPAADHLRARRSWRSVLGFGRELKRAGPDGRPRRGARLRARPGPGRHR